jgi:hypothetical protein
LLSDAKRGIGHELAADPEAPDGGRHVETGPAERLPEVPRHAEPVLRLERVEGHGGLEPQQARARSRTALADPAGLDQRHADARGREHVSRRAARQAAAENGHLHVERAAVARVGRLTGLGVTIQPVGDAVAGSHDFSCR